MQLALQKLAVGELTLRDQETLTELLLQITDEQLLAVLEQIGERSVSDCLDWCRRGLGGRIAQSFSWQWLLAGRMESAAPTNSATAGKAAVTLTTLRSELVERSTRLINDLQQKPIHSQPLQQAIAELQSRLVAEQQQLQQSHRELRELQELNDRLRTQEAELRELAEQAEQQRQSRQKLQQQLLQLAELKRPGADDPWLEIFQNDWRALRCLVNEADRSRLEECINKYPALWKTVQDLLAQVTKACDELMALRAEMIQQSKSSGENS